MEVCLEEIARCQQTSSWLNFLVLMGDRYGWRPLPATILASHVRQLLPHLPPDDRVRFDRWYDLDRNARPAAHRLLQRTPSGSARADSAWALDEPLLRGALERAGRVLPVDARLRYFSSATEQEVLRGVMSDDATGTVYCYVREGGPSSAEAVLAGFVDGAGGVPDEAAAAALTGLKRRLQQAPNVRMRTAHTSWRHGRPAGNPRPWLSSMVIADLGEEIERHADRARSSDPALEESSIHLAAAEERRRDFTGRAEPVRAVLETSARISGPPVLVMGPPGSGKSALLSEAAARIARSDANRAVIVRLIGVTSASSDERALIAGLCRELDQRHGRAAAPLPPDLQGLAQVLQGRLQEPPVGEGLLLVLDGIDQLRGDPRPLAWLPAELPAHVSLVLSTNSAAWLAEQQRRFGTLEQVTLPDMTDAEADELLRRWLDRAGRSLTTDQVHAVLAAFAAGRLPLQLRLAFEQARRWPSTSRPLRSCPAMQPVWSRSAWTRWRPTTARHWSRT
jgi:ribose 1,5-bisphosphokinase PhnN